MEEIKFRTLTPDDIDIRIGKKSEKMTVFLLYKNARVDMNILDETVGQQHWYRDHKELKGNLFCGVGIEVAPANIVWKWDCGTESNTEKEKGEASDSFKRACVNWGIGRELYSTPRIRIWNSTLEWNDNYLAHDLCVENIAYEEGTRRIKDLTIIDSETLEVKWMMVNGEVKVGVGAKAGSSQDKERAQQAASAKIKLTGELVKSGKAKKIVEFLSGYNPDDFYTYNQGLKKVEEKYEITTDGYSQLDLAVRALISARNNAAKA